MPRRFGVAGIVFALCASAAANARTLQASDIGRIVNLEQPALSPDGKRVALVAIFSDVARATYVDKLVLVDVASGAQRVLAAGHDVSVPRWSADGTQLGYLAAGSGGGSQLFVRDARGRVRQLTHAAGDIVDYAWRPGRGEIAFAAYDAPSSVTRGHHTYFQAGNNDYTATAPTPPVHLWLASAAGLARRLTAGAWTVAPTDRGGIFTSQFAWTPDGTALFFTRLDDTFAGDDERSRLQRLDLATGRIVNLTSHRYTEMTPQPAPGGSRLAYWYARNGEILGENELHVVAGGRDVIPTRALDRNVAGSLWMPGARSLLVCADDGAHVGAWMVKLDGNRRRLPLGALNVVCDSPSSSTFDAGIAASVSRQGSIALLAADARTPRELYYMRTPASAPRRLTRFNAFSAGLDLGPMRQFEWSGPLGRETGVLTYPPNALRGRRYPIVVLIHGGPGLASVDQFAWETWPLAHLIAAHGYLVFQPNYRGSDDGGDAFMRAIIRDTVAGPSQDILTGLAAVERLPRADGRRVAVSGWSYGGLLTSWLITQRHFWRAAVSGAAVNDETEEYDLSTSNVQNRYYLGTSPHTPGGRAIYDAQSPITFAHDVTTPTLIWATTGDPVVPIPLSYAFFHALRDNHVPAKLIVFPAASHGPDNPVDTQDLTTLWLGWLDRYMR